MRPRGKPPGDPASEDGHNVSVIDRVADAFKNLGRDFNGRIVRGIGFDESALVEAGIDEADVIAAVTSNDNANLMIAEVARRIYEVPHVITRLYEARREKTYAQLGIDFACGTTLVAEEIFSKIQSGHGHHIDTFGSYELARFAFNLEDDVTMSCSELERDYDARVVAVEHDDETILPSQDTILHDGDVAIVCVAREDFGRLSRFIRS
ncbi:MAG: TrkA family potassium uptake protein [Coriobacteriales bacterium]